jgi:hypothetical protein
MYFDDSDKICLIKNKLKNFDYIKDITNNEITKEEYEYLIYMLDKTDPKLFHNIKILQQSRLKKIISGVHEKNLKLIKQIEKNYLENINLDTFGDLMDDPVKYLYIMYIENIKKIIIEDNKCIGEPCDYFYYLIFNIKKICNQLKLLNPNDLNKIKFLELFFNQIEKKIIIKIDDCKFILISTIYDDIRLHYKLKSSKECEKKINTLIYYASNSELGFLRWASMIEDPINHSIIYAKFLDYATETMVDFRLQKELYKRKFDVIQKKEKIILPNAFDDNNLKLLKIVKKDSEYIELRGYFNYIFYCFSTFNCGELFKKKNNNYNNELSKFKDTILDVIKYVNKNIKNEIKSLPIINKTDYTEFLINDNKMVLGNIIQIENLNDFSKKLMDMIELANEGLNEETYKTISFDSIVCHYTIMGKFLNLIIDEIIDEELNIYEFTYTIDSNIENYKYIFANTVNKLTVKIDKVCWDIYWIDYKISIINNDTNEFSQFDHDYDNYMNIVKIIPHSCNKINESGLDNGFIMAGTLQCKSVEYIKQLTGVLSGLVFDSENKITTESILDLAQTDKNILNTEYYFIGQYVNLIFDNVSKYNFRKKEESIKYEELSKKYLKYKYKYLLNKNK